MGTGDVCVCPGPVPSSAVKTSGPLLQTRPNRQPLMMCGGFQCSKNTLLGLNILYVVVAFLLIGVATYGKSSAVITSLPILGGIVASGVFLLFVAVLGLLATLKHHQILLFVYMIVMFGIFIIQFSVSCAAIGVDENQEMKTIETVWKTTKNNSATRSAIIDAEKVLNCCDWNQADRASNSTCPEVPGCVNAKSEPSCSLCEPIIREAVDSAFNGSGGVGLFFAFTEFVAIVITAKFRKEVRDLQPLP